MVINHENKNKRNHFLRSHRKAFDSALAIPSLDQVYEAKLLGAQFARLLAPSTSLSMYPV